MQVGHRGSFRGSRLAPSKPIRVKIGLSGLSPDDKKPPSERSPVPAPGGAEGPRAIRAGP
ncbi:Hypothetical Protein RSKD131_2175 [Cereibacter sphaeroides KD131]|nr:Hypothetical Protein RSKD131_2175 [Cereibacter sphaeroides KD131]